MWFLKTVLCFYWRLFVCWTCFLSVDNVVKKFIICVPTTKMRSGKRIKWRVALVQEKNTQASGWFQPSTFLKTIIGKACDCLLIHRASRSKFNRYLCGFIFVYDVLLVPVFFKDSSTRTAKNYEGESALCHVSCAWNALKNWLVPYFADHIPWFFLEMQCARVIRELCS